MASRLDFLELTDTLSAKRSSPRCEGLPRPAYPGNPSPRPRAARSSLWLASASLGQILRGQPNIVDVIELIGNQCRSDGVKTQNMKEQPGTLVYETVLPEGGLTVRARGRRIVPDAPDLMFYTNPVRIVAQPLPLAADEVGH